MKKEGKVLSNFLSGTTGRRNKKTISSPDPAFPFAMTARKDPRELEEPPVLPAYAYKIPDQNSHRRYAPPMMTTRMSAIRITHQNHFISLPPFRT